jgi:hypothetical protein
VLPKLTGAVVRDGAGGTVGQSAGREGVSLPGGAYDLEVTTAPVKL